MAAAGTAARLKRGLMLLAFRSPFYNASLGRTGPRHLVLVPPDPWPGSAARGIQLIEGEYRFAGQVVRTDGAPWQAQGASDEFLAALHGFDWLRDLRALGNDAARQHGRMLIGSWLDRHDRWHPVVWAPDVLGERVAAWLAAHDFVLAGAEDALRLRLLKSLSRQVRHLARVVPGEADGSPLITALKGLIYGALALPRGSDRLALGLDLLEEALADQILADGGHAERNPDTHLTVVRHLVDLRTLLRSVAVPAEDLAGIQEAIERMAPALSRLRHADGGLPQFNGAHAGDRARIDAALILAEIRGDAPQPQPQPGFVRLAAGRTVVLVDAGPPPEPGLDIAGHAGTLSFEMSVGRDRLIVNCGAWDGSAGSGADAWRQALRGTAAHSTVVIADTNSSAVQDDGLGRRPGLVAVARREADGAVLVEASHDGYGPVFGLIHQRLIYLNPTGDDLRGEDSLVAAPDADAGGHPFVARFHLHPSVEAVLAPAGPGAVLRLKNGESWRLRATGEVAIEESVYCPDGETRQRSAQVTVAGATARDGAVIRWALRREV